MPPDGAPRVRLSELNRDRSRAIAAAGGVAVLPIGATEQHGPHLPTGTDAFTVDYIATRAAELVARRVPVVVCPTQPYGVSQHHLPFGATGSLSPATMLALLVDIGESLIASGFGRIFIVNGHGGNHDVMGVAMSELSSRHRVSLAGVSWWQLANDGLVAAGALERGGIAGHAGSFESSIILALRPELAGTLPSRPDAESGVSAMRAALAARRPDDWTEIDGYTDSPARADAAAGTAYLEAGITALAAAIEWFAEGT
jgi:creatinine amidohydrolase